MNYIKLGFLFSGDFGYRHHHHQNLQGFGLLAR